MNLDPRLVRHRAYQHLASPGGSIPSAIQWRGHQHENGGFATGCSFPDELDAAVAAELATLAGIDRRNQVRQQHHIELMVQVAGNPNPNPIEAKLKDYSATGVGFTCDQEVKAGSAIKLTLKRREDSLDANATIFWSEINDDGEYEYGCEWTNLNIQSVLKNWIGQEEESFTIHRRRLISLAGSLTAIGMGIASWIILGAM